MVADFRKLYALEMAVIPVVNRIEARGLCWDSRLARREDRKIQQKIGKLLRSDAMAGVNPASPQQVKQHVLALGMPEALLMSKGKVTTGQEQIEIAIGHLKENPKWRHVGSAVVRRVGRFVDALCAYRHLAKVSKTYLGPCSDMADRNGGVIYVSINPFGAVTGRMSGWGQQMPKSSDAMLPEHRTVRRCVVCRDGYEMWYFDYAQMEVYVFGAVAGIEPIVAAYEAGFDVYEHVAAEIYGAGEAAKRERQHMKQVCLATIYGQGIRLLAAKMAMSLSEAKRVYADVCDVLPGIKDYQDEIEARLQTDGWITDWFGRRHSLKPSEAYKGVNYIVQGSCASIFKRALVQVDERLDDEAHIVLPVHDEIQLEAPQYGEEDRDLLVRCVTGAMLDIEELSDRGLRLRLDVQRSATCWADKQAI